MPPPYMVVPPDAPGAAPPVLPPPPLPPTNVPPRLEEYRPPVLPPIAPPVLATPRRVSPLVFVVLGVLVIAASLGLVLPGELGSFFEGSWEVMPFALLCVLAYLGVERLWARVLAWGLLAGILVFAAVLNLGFSYLALTSGKGFTEQLPPGGGPLLTLITLATLIAALSAVLAWVPGFRSVSTALTGTTEWTPVRRLALATVVSFTLTCCVPLTALGEPPVLEMLRSTSVDDNPLIDERGPAGLLRDQMYSLIWTLVAAALAVGCGIARNGRETLERLGLRRLTVRQLGAAILLIAAVLGVGQGMDWGTTRVWQQFGWRTTDLDAVEALFDPFLSPVGAVVVGLSAGLGEEVAVRGILQPRLGILLSNLFFTALHAYQYNWDGLLSVFVTGLALGLIRKKSSTSLAAVVHGGFDFVLVMVEVISSGTT